MSSSPTYWNERYTSGSIPWDSGITPPEVEAFWEQYGAAFGERDLVLDLGCGTLTNLAFLAMQGVTAFGMDLSEKALQKGSARMVTSREHGLRAAALVGSVAQLPLADGVFSYALDLGCLHTLELQERPSYVENLCRVLVPAGFYQVFGFQRLDGGPSQDGQRRYFLPGELSDLFDSSFETISEKLDTEAKEGCKGVWRLMRLL